MKLVQLILMIVVLILGYGFLIEPYRIEITHQSIDPGLFGAHLAGKTAIQLTDLHLRRFGSHEQKIIKIVNALRPDFIFLTGDYVKWRGDYEPALEFMSHLQAKHGVWGVMGDYDYGDSRKNCLFCHAPDCKTLTKRHSVRFLANQTAQIPVNGGVLTIGGLDSGTPMSAFWAINKAPTAPMILLAHSPMLFNELEADQPMLMLAGDTHGGQIPLPSKLWSVIGYEKNAQYGEGFFLQQHHQMYVSRGTGSSHLPFRFLRPPEITVFHF